MDKASGTGRVLDKWLHNIRKGNSCIQCTADSGSYTDNSTGNHKAVNKANKMNNIGADSCNHNIGKDLHIGMMQMIHKS
jgi:hypothetical protein